MDSAIWKKTRIVYAHLQDDISRNIYENRLLYVFLKDKKYMRNIFDRMEIGRKFYAELKRHDTQTLVIFGCGTYGKAIVDFYPEFSWAGYVDNFVKEGTIVNGLTVFSLSKIQRIYPEAYFVLAMRDVESIEKIQKQLNDAGVSDAYIYPLGKYLAKSMDERQYFDLPYMSPVENEVFIDAGVLDGNSSLQFVRWSKGKYRHIYMFEPEQSCFQKIEANLENVYNASLIRKGLWSREEKLVWEENEQGIYGLVENKQKFAPPQWTFRLAYHWMKFWLTKQLLLLKWILKELNLKHCVELHILSKQNILGAQSAYTIKNVICGRYRCCYWS